VARDLRQKRYQTFEELTAYAYGVASTVGLMSMHIIGYSGAEALPYAIKLGVALQITNILRDVGEDWRAGRIYLPLEELAAFGLTDADVAAGRVDERWRSLMRFQIARNRRLYAEAMPGIKMLNSDGRFAVAAAGELYRAILGEIEAHDYDVFDRRAHVGAWGKLRRLPGIWWRSR
jgi:phytoene synthase